MAAIVSTTYVNKRSRKILLVALDSPDVGVNVGLNELVGIQELPGVVVASHPVSIKAVSLGEVTAELVWATTAPATTSS